MGGREGSETAQRPKVQGTFRGGAGSGQAGRMMLPGNDIRARLWWENLYKSYPGAIGISRIGTWSEPICVKFLLAWQEDGA
jgi:hypothetical protein